MSTATIAATEDGVAEKNLDLAFDLMQAALLDPDALADFPKNATTILLPGDDPDLYTANIEIGMAALRRGENVYFRHVSSPSRTVNDM
jgi:hypothetical protein